MALEVLASSDLYTWLPDGELNLGLPRDRRGSLPLDYQGFGDDEKRGSFPTYNAFPNTDTYFVC